MANLYLNTERSPFLLDPTLESIVWTRVAGVPTYKDKDNPIQFSFGTSDQPEILVDKLQLGDGYEQVTESGIQSHRLRYTLLFNRKPYAVIVALRRFFLGGGANSIYNRRPSEWFWFKAGYPFELANEEPKKFLASFSSNAQEWNNHSMTVDLVQSFEP